MKAVVLVLFVVSMGLLAAEISPFSLVGEGDFAGKLGAYANGDTIVFVTKPPEPNTIRYRYSFDGGANWQSTDWVINGLDEHNVPTLSHNGIETIIGCTTSNQGFTSISNNFIDFSGFEPRDLFSFDPTPYFERINGLLTSFSIDTPYPNKILVNGAMQDFPKEHAIIDGEYVAPLEFSDSEYSPEGEAQYYTGKDVVNGIVRSNHALHIKQTDEGANNGWPVFNHPVVIGGTVLSIPEDYPRDLVFRGGLMENAPPMEFGTGLPSGTNVSIVGPQEYNPDRIVRITVNGSSYTAMLGTVTAPRQCFTDVWTQYPDTTYEPPLFSNTFTVTDTLWEQLPREISAGRINYVNNKLQIKGDFWGKQTWWSSQDIELIGDIISAGTNPPGDPIYNTYSKVSLVSNKNIIIKYGSYEPLDSQRFHDNMGSDMDYPAPAGGGIFIYASLYALGNSPNANQQDGCFTFEYQHPHPSTPAVWYTGYSGEPELIDWIDLHRNRYPQTTNAPWPAYLDYPWYNPLWPEARPYLERGTVNLWGSVYQKWKGVIHRDYAGHPEGSWNIGLGHYGGSSSPDEGYIDPVLGINMQTRNYPGAEGDGVGYKKNYNPDVRAKLDIGFNDNDVSTIWNLGLNLSNYNPSNGQRSVYYRKPYTRYTKDKCFARLGDRAYYSLNNVLVNADGEMITDLSGTTVNNGTIRGIALKPDASPLVYQLAEMDSMYSMTIKDINEATGSVNHQIGITVPSMLNDVCVMPNGRRLVAAYQSPNTIKLWELNQQNVLAHVEDWSIGANIMPDADRIKTSRLYLLPSSESRVEVLFYIPADANNPASSASLYHANAAFPVSNEDYYIPATPAIKFSAYPNPMRGELKMQIENGKGKHLSISVHNIRGQLVQHIPLEGYADNAKIEYVWDGMDKNHQRVANGVYLLRLVADNKAVVTKRICRY